MSLTENKNLAVNIANALMQGKIGNKEYLIEEYMELYFQVINGEELGINDVTKEEAYYLAVNIANTLMQGMIGNKEDLIEEYMELYSQAISYNKYIFDKNEITEEISRYLAVNIANTFMVGKMGDKKDLIEEYMDIYNKAILYNNSQKKNNYFDTTKDLDEKPQMSNYFEVAGDLEEPARGKGR